MDWFINLFKPKHTFKLTATFHMKSGSKLIIPCDDLTWKTDGNNLLSYNISGMQSGRLSFCALNQVEAITYVKNKNGKSKS